MYVLVGGVAVVHVTAPTIRTSIVGATPTGRASALGEVERDGTTVRMSAHALGAPQSLAGGSARRVGSGPTGRSGTTRGEELTLQPSPRLAPAGTNLSAQGWVGINESDCACQVPDPNVAVGAGYVVESAGGELTAWSLSGTWIGNESLGSLFEVTGPAPLGEPTVLFDSFTAEWIVVAVDSSNDTLAVVASDGVLPWASREAYFVPAYPNERPDLPSVGASSWMVEIAANDANETTGNLDGTGYILLNRTELLSGTLSYYEANPQYWFPNGHADEQLSASPDAWFGGVAPSPGTGVGYWIRWANAPPALPTYSTAGPSIAAYSASPPAPQPGTADLLNTSEGNDGRVESSTFQNGLETLVLSTGTGCPSAYSCVDLVQVNASSGVLRQDLAIGSSAYALFDPSVSADAQGDLTLTVVVASSTVYPSLYVFGQAWNEPNRTTDGSFFAENGTGALTSGCNVADVCAFGWATGSTTVPESATVWSVGEVVESPDSWSTWVQSALTSNASLSLLAEPAQLDLGQATIFSSRGIPGTSDLGDYRWSGLPPGCPGADVPTLNCQPTAAGHYDVSVSANDTYPTVAIAWASLTVNADPVVATPTANASGADVGQIRNFSTTAQFGTPPYSFAWYGLPPTGCTNSTGPSITCEFSQNGNLTISVAVTDATGTRSSSGAAPYRVSSSLQFISLGAGNFSSAVPLSPVTFYATADGGASPRNYSWSGLPGPCTGVNGPRVLCTPSRPGLYDVTVRIRDANGAVVESPPLPWSVTAPAANTPTGLFGLPEDEAWALGIALAAVGVLAGVVVAVRFARRPPPSPPDHERPETLDDDWPPEPS